MGSGNTKPSTAQALPNFPTKKWASNANGVGNGAAVSPVDERVVVQVGEYLVVLEPQRALLSSRKRRLNPGLLAPITGLRATVNNQASDDVFDVVLPCKEVAEAHAYATKETSKRASIDPSSVASRSDSLQRQQSGASSVKSSRSTRKGRNLLLLDGLAPQALATVPGLLAFLEDALTRARDDVQAHGAGSNGSGTPMSPSSSTAMVTREAAETSIFKVPGLRCEVYEEGYNFCVRASVEVGTPGSWSWSSYAVSLDVPCVQRGQSKALTVWQGGNDSGPASSSGPASPSHKVTTTTTTVNTQPWLLRKKITVKTVVREVPGPDPSRSVGGGSNSPGSPFEKNLPPLLALENRGSTSRRSSSSSSAFGGVSRNKEHDLPPLLQKADEGHLSNVPDDVVAAFRKCDLDGSIFFRLPRQFCHNHFDFVSLLSMSLSYYFTFHVVFFCPVVGSGDLNAFELAHAIAELYGFPPSQAQVEEVMERGVPSLANRREDFDATYHALTLRQFADAVVSDAPDAPTSSGPLENMPLYESAVGHPKDEEEEEVIQEKEEDDEEEEAFEELFYGRALGFRASLDPDSSTLIVDRVMDRALEGRVRMGDRVFTVNGVPLGPVRRRHALQAKLATVPGRPVKIGFLRASAAVAANGRANSGGANGGLGDDGGGAEEAKGGSEAYDDDHHNYRKGHHSQCHTNNTNNNYHNNNHQYQAPVPAPAQADRKGGYAGRRKEASRSPATVSAMPINNGPLQEDVSAAPAAAPAPAPAAAPTSAPGPAPTPAPAAAAFELACDDCDQWFLNTEVGVSIHDTESMEGWFCLKCRPETAPLATRTTTSSNNTKASAKSRAMQFLATKSSAAASKGTPTKSPVAAAAASKAKSSEEANTAPVADASFSDDGGNLNYNDAFDAAAAPSPIRSPNRQRSNSHSLMSTPPRGNRRNLPPLSPLSPQVGTGDGGGSVASSVDGSEPAAPERVQEDQPQPPPVAHMSTTVAQAQATQRAPTWFRGKMFSNARPQSAGAVRPATAPRAEAPTAVPPSRPQTAMVAGNPGAGSGPGKSRSMVVAGGRPNTAAAAHVEAQESSSALVEVEARQRSQAEAMLQHAHYAQQARAHNLKSPLASMTQFSPLSPGLASQPFPRDFILNFGDSAARAASSSSSSSSFNPGMVVDQNSGVVLSVNRGGAADRAGIRAGFTILEVGGVAVNSAEEVADALFYFRRRSRVEKQGHAEPTVALLCIPGEARTPAQLAAAAGGAGAGVLELLEPPLISRNSSAHQLAAVNQVSPYAGLAGALSATPNYAGPGQRGARAGSIPQRGRQRNSRRY